MPMKQTILFLGAIFGMLGSVLADEKAGVANVLTDAEKAEGWSLLFDGKDLSQWRNMKQEVVIVKLGFIQDAQWKPGEIRFQAFCSH